VNQDLPATAGEAIPVLARDGGPLPLSFAQQRLWFLDEFESGTAEYVSSSAARLRGTLDATALDAALTGLVARHESLRTTFHTIDGRGVQLIHPPGPVQVPVRDLSALLGPERDAALRTALAEDCTQPFDLSRGPLLRTRLLRLAEDDHVLTLSMHHIITDGWSAGLITHELSELYAAAADGRPAALSPLPVQYADYAAWQRARLEDADMARHIGYWKQQLSGIAPLELPADRPRPPVRTSAGDSCEFVVPAEVTARLADLARRHDGTLFMTLAAACQVLFHRWSGQDDIAVGTAVAGRNRAELEGIVGFFVNTVVLRCTVDGRRPFSEFLTEVREAVLDAFAHQDAPFERVVDELGLPRDTSRSPLFQAMVVLQNTPAPAAAPAMPGLSIEELAPPLVAVGCDVVVEFHERDDVLTGSLTYNTDLFDRVTVERMAGHLQVLLAGIAADAARRIRELPMLTEPERELVLSGWNDSGHPVPPATLAGLFEARARQLPDAPAVLSASGQPILSYAELDRRASQLAHLLARHGAGPEQVVALALPRSADIIIAQLATAKAGAAFLPVDPGYPADRIALMLADARPALTLTRHDAAAALAGLDASPVLVLDDPATTTLLDAMPAHPPAVRQALGHPAYMIFTSGSTGRPKGVVVSHAGLASFAAAEADHYQVRPGDRVLQFSSPSFDASVLELCMSLPAGAALVVPPPGPLLGQQLAQVLATGRITHALIPPAALATVPAEAAGAGLPDLRTLIVGGDACPAELAQRWAPGRRMINSYGPTESTVVATWSGPLTPAPTAPPIGRPIWNTRCYVLDQQLRPAPPGIPGQLHITGPGLARGYHNQPGLTAQRFIACPYGPPGQRMYATGDLARWTPDGQLQHLGRTDDQVKIRGYRIEPAEIETVLRRHPAIAQAIVTPRQDQPGRKHLAAYVVPASGQQPGPEELRGHLAQFLPEYMVPAAVITLDRLPLSPNGKVDRSALPAPEASARAGASYTAPRTDAEVVIAGIWATVLGVDQVGIHDSFFDLGGDSVRSLAVAARAKAAFDVALTPREVLVTRTVAGLAELVEDKVLAELEQIALSVGDDKR
jgi:amino acid adenylation domain-containing protein